MDTFKIPVTGELCKKDTPKSNERGELCKNDTSKSNERGEVLRILWSQKLKKTNKYSITNLFFCTKTLKNKMENHIHFIKMFVHCCFENAI